MFLCPQLGSHCACSYLCRTHIANLVPGKILNENDRDQVLWAREAEHCTQTFAFTKTAGSHNLVEVISQVFPSPFQYAILESDKTLGTRLKVFQRMRSFWSAPRITKMAARALHRVCCSAVYCQVSRHVSSLFRLQMTNTSVKHNKGFQLFYRGFFVSKGSWRSFSVLCMV